MRSNLRETLEIGTVNPDDNQYELSNNGHQEYNPNFRQNVTWLDRWLVHKMLEIAGNPRVRISLWDGVEVTPPYEDPIAVMVYSDRGALLKSIVDPELYWGDLYSKDRVKFEGNLTEFMQTVFLGIRGRKDKRSLIRKMVLWLDRRFISRSQDNAKENIHHHYDLGNEFYKLWLDKEEMQYTCAYFPHNSITLEEAQIAKLHHVCRKLQLKPGDVVVEAGCGWGGLARFMAKQYGVTVRAYNISVEQVNYARRRAEEEGLSDSVEYVLEDYRNIQGEYDVFVSVGMLEHVAKTDYNELGTVISRCLKPDGRGLVHSIGRRSSGHMNAWIERRVFPGASPPALSEMMQIFEPNSLVVYDVENLRFHYVRTLELWSERFEHHRKKITEMMDEEFVKTWSLYLSGSIAAFSTGELNLFQVVFYRSEIDSVPWSRQHIYDPKNIVTGKAKLNVVSSDAVAE